MSTDATQTPGAETPCAQPQVNVVPSSPPSPKAHLLIQKHVLLATLASTASGSSQATPTTTLINTSAVGVAGNVGADNGNSSDDGTLVTFFSYSTNLVPGDTNGVQDVFVKDLPSGAIRRVSVSYAGAQDKDK